jgi:hypothetical protein
MGLMTRNLLLFDSYCLVSVGRPLWQEDESAFCICCWPLLAQSFLSSSPLGLMTIFYCLRFETSLFVASCDSQGHDGVKVKVKVILRLTISQSVSLGTEHLPGAHDQIYIFFLIWKFLSCSIGAPSLTRGRVCHLSVIVRISKSIVSIHIYSFSLYNPSVPNTQKTQPLYCWVGLFTDPLPSNGRPIIVLFGSAGMYIQRVVD